MRKKMRDTERDQGGRAIGAIDLKGPSRAVCVCVYVCVCVCVCVRARARARACVCKIWVSDQLIFLSSIYVMGAASR